VIETPQNVFILHSIGEIDKVDMCLPLDITKRQKLIQCGSLNNTGATMAVSEKHIVMNHPDTKQLIIYDFITKQTETIYPDVYPIGLHFLPDGHLLGVGGGKLIKYKIENRTLTTVWTCDDVTNGNKVCSDSNELIYVSAKNNLKTVYIMSPGGKTLIY